MENKKIKNKINGLIILDKEKSYTSNDCLAIIKKILHPEKIGHTGTLDTNATGVLVCLLGKGTKSQDYLMSIGEKIYEAELILGFSTDTEDITGKNEDRYTIDEESIIISPDSDFILLDKKKITKDDIVNAVKSFISEYNQVPPMYSAKKVAGKKLINMARKGIIIERKANAVKIYDIEVNGMRAFTCIGNNESANKMFSLASVDIKVRCSKGTYIRTLCKDIGEKLGVEACMGNLRRLATGDFKIEDAVTLDTIKEKVSKNDFSFIRPCYYIAKPQVLTFGKFETLHLGHKKVIDTVVKCAKVMGIESTVLSIGNSFDSKVLTSAQRISKLKYLGVDNLYDFPLDENNKKMSPETFITEILINELKVKKVVVGSDCSFGAGGKGDKNLLIEICKKRGVEVIVIDKLKVKDINITDNEYKDMDISSTLINSEYKKNNMKLINKLMGRE